MSNEPKASMDLDPEMLAAYIDKRLTPEQRAAVEAQLAKDPDSYALLVETLKAQDALGRSEELRPSASSKSGWKIAIGVLAAAAVVSLIVWTAPDLLERIRGNRDPVLEQLVAAVGQERYVDARTTGGFAYAPVKTVTRSPGDLATQNLSLLAAAGELQRRAQSTPNGNNLHAWGIAQITLGAFDEAVETLTTTLSMRPGDAAVLADLSAAQLARAASQSRADDWPAALANAERALQRDPQLKEALYNRAVALEGLALNQEAIAAWNDYLAVENEVAWRNEAQQRIARLSSKSESAEVSDPRDDAIVQLVESNAQRARELFESRLLFAWADAVVSDNDAGAYQAMALATAVASALQVRGHRGPTSAIEELRSETNRLRRRRLAEGYRAYARALIEFENDRVPAAGPLFAEAERLLADSQSPYRLWCSFNLATVKYFNGDLPAASSVATSLLNDAKVKAIPELHARVLWGAGLFSLVRGDLQNSLNWYRKSAELYRDLGEIENETFLNTLTAEALDFSGNTDAAWAYRLRALTNRSPSYNVRRPHTTLLNAAVAAMRQGMPEVAVHLANEAMLLVERRDQPRLTLESVLYRGRAYALAGRVIDAERDLDAAQARLDGMPAPLKTRYASEIALTRSYLPQADVETLTAASEKFLRDTGTTVRVPQLQLAMARARAKAGDATGAQAVLDDAIRQVTNASSGLIEGLRWSYADQSWPVFREAAILRLEQQRDVAAAIDIAEGGRLSRAEQTAAVDVARHLGPHEAVVRFLIGENRLHAVLMRDGSFSDVVIDLDAEEVERLAGRFRDALSRNDPAASIVLEDVGRWLVTPWLNAVPAGDVITIIPDGPLHFVSLAPAKITGGRYLVERNPLRTAPDLSLARQRIVRTAPRVVAVGVGQFDAMDLAPLPGAIVEAKSIAASYPDARLLTAGDATVANVLNQATSANILHFATHGSANPDYPNLSWIALRADAEHAQGLLFSHEIRSLNLSRLDVAFLSTCDGSRGQLSRAEGEASLARAFIDAGAGAVIASSWRVADASALAISEAFHREYARSSDVVDAVRGAQMAAIRSPDPAISAPQAWGAFRVYSRISHPQETTR